MSPRDVHSAGIWALLALSVVTFVALLFVTAPYGRHRREGWGPTLPSRVGWVVMELPSVALFIAVFFMGEHALELAPLVMLSFWQVHYVHRTFIFPLRMRAEGRRMPVLIAALGFSFNCLNAWLNASWISQWGSYGAAWLTEPAFLAGALLFGVGMAINVRADDVLFRLRREGEGYRLPRGGLFEYVCSPNYLGEILEWAGWAVLTWSLPGLGFAIYTVANLVPRALAHRRWYIETFGDFPRSRRALIPFLL